MLIPETRYASSGDISIAYQVVGEGPFDLVVIPGAGSHVQFIWEVPVFRVWLEGLASFSRLIFFDKRGTGMSDRVKGIADLATRMDDVRAVMDAAGSERAAVYGASEGVALGILFAASYPQRCWALVLYGGLSRQLWAPDYPWGCTEAEYRRLIAEEKPAFTTPGVIEGWCRESAPNAPEDEIRALAAHDRYAFSPQAAEDLTRMNMEIDVREALPAIRVPTLVLHRPLDRGVSIEHGRYIASHVPGAQLVEVPGAGHVGSVAEMPPIIEQTRRFLRRVWEAGAEEQAPDRVLATVLFSDIVGSSEKAASLGDRAWRELLERHHELVRRQLVRFRGQEVDTAGDGFFASFDGPARAIRCGCAITEAMRDLGLQVRVGLHTGECELIEGKVAGIAVHTGARVAANAQPGEVLVSSTVKDLVAGSGLAFQDRGTHELRGIPGEWRLYAVRQP